MLVPDNMIPGEDIQNSSPFDPQQKGTEYAQNNGPLSPDFTPVTNINSMEEAVEHVEAYDIWEAKKELKKNVSYNLTLFQCSILPLK
jgi:hypothetical protein